MSVVCECGVRMWECQCVRVHVCVDEWMDGWMGVWMDGCVDGWMDGCVSVCVCRVYACLLCSLFLFDVSLRECVFCLFMGVCCDAVVVLCCVGWTSVSV